MLNKFALAALLCIASFASSAFAAATVTIQNGDTPGVGFNDATPASPIGGNSGTTLGQQRLIAFQAAADKWGSTIASNPTITVLATWISLPCTSTSAVLGSAGPISVWSDFVGATQPGTWYPAALANALYTGDLDPANPEILARFNLNLGQSGCLEGKPFYLGLDDNFGSQVDLVTVLTHELGHGLGFTTFTSGTTGEYFYGLPSIWDTFLFDNSLNLPWTQLTAAQRVASAVSQTHLAWNGPQVKADVPSVLRAGMPQFAVTAPANVAGSYQFGTATFGPALASPGISADIARIIDTAPSFGYACSALSGANAAAVAGKIALIDRGACNFTVKAENVQNAGAIAAIIVNSVPGTPPGLSGTDPNVTIPVISLSQADGNYLKAALSKASRRSTGVSATLDINNLLYAGADYAGRPLMYAPNPFQPGSSVAHWDTSLTPNQLMEPAINVDLTHEVTVPFDLTYSLLRDIGWQ